MSVALRVQPRSTTANPKVSSTRPQAETMQRARICISRTKATSPDRTIAWTDLDQRGPMGRSATARFLQLNIAESRFSARMGATYSLFSDTALS